MSRQDQKHRSSQILTYLIPLLVKSLHPVQSSNFKHGKKIKRKCTFFKLQQNKSITVMLKFFKRRKYKLQFNNGIFYSLIFTGSLRNNHKMLPFLCKYQHRTSTTITMFDMLSKTPNNIYVFSSNHKIKLFGVMQTRVK